MAKSDIYNVMNKVSIDDAKFMSNIEELKGSADHNDKNMYFYITIRYET